MGYNDGIELMEMGMKPCPFCKKDDQSLGRHGKGFWVECNDCLACGPYHDDAVKAVELWNSIRPVEKLPCKYCSDTGIIAKGTYQEEKCLCKKS